MFAILSLATGPIIYLFYPETANRTLEDMDQIFIHNPGALVFANRAATQSKRPQVFIEAEALRIGQAQNESRDAVFVPDEKEKYPRESVLEV